MAATTKLLSLPQPVHGQPYTSFYGDNPRKVSGLDSDGELGLILRAAAHHGDVRGMVKAIEKQISPANQESRPSPISTKIRQIITKVQQALGFASDARSTHYKLGGMSGGVVSNVVLPGVSAALGLAAASMKYQSARKRRDREGKLLFGAQILRCTSRGLSVIISIASSFLSTDMATRMGSMLSQVSGILTAIAMASLTFVAALRVWDIHKLAMLGLDQEKIRENFTHLTLKELRSCGLVDAKYNQEWLDKFNRTSWGKALDSGIREHRWDAKIVAALTNSHSGKVDRLSRALANGGFAEKIADTKEVDQNQLNAAIRWNRGFSGTTLGLAIAADIINGLAFVFIVLKPVKDVFSIVTNFFWLVMDGKFLLEDLRAQKTVSKSMKVAYAVMIAFSVSSIIVGSLFTFGALPAAAVIGIGIAATIASLTPYVINYFERKQRIQESAEALIATVTYLNMESEKSNPRRITSNLYPAKKPHVYSPQRMLGFQKRSVA